MTYDPNRDPYSPTRPTYAEESGGGTALFIGAIVLLALVFGGVYFYANDQNSRVASDMTISTPPITQPTNPAAPAPSNDPARSAPMPAPNTQR